MGKLIRENCPVALGKLKCLSGRNRKLQTNLQEFQIVPTPYNASVQILYAQKLWISLLSSIDVLMVQSTNMHANMKIFAILGDLIKVCY